MNYACHDALSEQVGQMAVDGRVRFAQDERQLCQFDERHPAEGVDICRSEIPMARA